MSEKMERGNDVLKTRFEGMSQMVIRQVRHLWTFECSNPAEFLYFDVETGEPFAGSLDDTSGCCRMCCGMCHPYSMTVRDFGSLEQVPEEAVVSEVIGRDANQPELLTVNHTYRCCQAEEATFMTGEHKLGSAKEVSCALACVPALKVYDASGTAVYLLRSPTCCGGLCPDMCSTTDGSACCKVPFHVFRPDEQSPSSAKAIGLVVQLPKSHWYTGTMGTGEPDPLDVTVAFPEDATPEQKALLMGTGIFLNAIFFGGTDFVDYGAA